MQHGQPACPTSAEYLPNHSSFQPLTTTHAKEECHSAADAPHLQSAMGARLSMTRLSKCATHSSLTQPGPPQQSNAPVVTIDRFERTGPLQKHHRCTAVELIAAYRDVFDSRYEAYYGPAICLRPTGHLECWPTKNPGSGNRCGINHSCPNR